MRTNFQLIPVQIIRLQIKLELGQIDLSIMASYNALSNPTIIVCKL